MVAEKRPLLKDGKPRRGEGKEGGNQEGKRAGGEGKGGWQEKEGKAGAEGKTGASGRDRFPETPAVDGDDEDSGDASDI